MDKKWNIQAMSESFGKKARHLLVGRVRGKSLENPPAGPDMFIGQISRLY